MLRPLMVLVLLASTAAADPVRVLRMAAVAPEGTAWARELRAFSRDVETLSSGAVRLKWYMGGIAGDELQVGDRIQRSQLDGTAAGGMLCARLAPSWRVMQVMGLFAAPDEVFYVLERLRERLDAEFAASGFEELGMTSMGRDVLFLRKPAASLGELQKLRLWRWDLDQVGTAVARAMGLSVTPLSLNDAAAAYDEGRIDGFFAVPMAALAFQWYTRTKYFMDFSAMSYLSGCLVVSRRSFNALSFEQQRTLRGAAAKFIGRLETVSRFQEQELLRTVFPAQGLKRLPVEGTFRAEFFDAARQARGQVDRKLVDPALLDLVQKLLADYRAEHPGSRP